MACENLERAVSEEPEMKSVAETVWPWRVPTPPPEPTPTRKRVLIETLIGLAASAILYFVFQKPVTALVALCIALFLGCSGLLAPKVYRSIKKGVSRTAHAFGVLLTWVISVFTVFLIFPIARLHFLLTRKDPLGKSVDPHKLSYWSEWKNPEKRESYERQY